MEKVLLDTNLLIYREDHGIVNDDVSKLFKILYDSELYKIVIHPMSVDDINNLKDEGLKKITLSKIALYSRIENPPVADAAFHSKVGCKKEPNDRIDNNLLFAVCRNCVSFLITNDRSLREKAKCLGLENRVLGISDAIAYFAPKEEGNVYRPFNVHRERLYTLDPNNPFFNSLKETYWEFDKWYETKSKNGAFCYYTLQDDDINIGSFLIIKQQKDEIEPDFEEQLDHGLKIKICTLKVVDRGKHIGESLLKIAFNEAKRVGANQVFLTVFEDEQEELVDLIKEYGFYKKTTKKTKKANGNNEIEAVYVNNLKGEGYPNINWNATSYVVPIKPRFHHKLFPDAETTSQIEIADLISSNPYSNAIKKAYVCNSPSSNLRHGDILFFYASKQIKGITAIGVVDEMFSNFESTEEMLAVAKKRTVYTREELDAIHKRGNAKVIMFKYYDPLEKPLRYEELHEESILKWYPQSITKVDTQKMKHLVDRRQTN